MNNPAIDLPLKEIHLPAAISWWPLAPAWWILFGVLLSALFFAVFLFRRLKRSSLKKQALQALKKIEHTFEETEDARQCLSELSVFLRRVALSQKLSQKCAGLTGPAWLQFLDEPLGKPEFSQGIGQLLLNGPYQAQVQKEGTFELLQLCRRWVKCL